VAKRSATVIDSANGPVSSVAVSTFGVRSVGRDFKAELRSQLRITDPATSDADLMIAAVAEIKQLKALLAN